MKKKNHVMTWKFDLQAIINVLPPLPIVRTCLMRTFEIEASLKRCSSPRRRLASTVIDWLERWSLPHIEQTPHQRPNHRGTPWMVGSPLIFFYLMFRSLTYASLNSKIILKNLFQMGTNFNYDFSHLSTKTSAMLVPNHTCHSKYSLQSSRASKNCEHKFCCLSKARIKSFSVLPKFSRAISIHLLCVGCVAFYFVQ